ncbi:hypothetical protein QBC44DRAFT_310321 [Cladorrhinum sp. PSN332]|nr:hypothetical protein QBC44DRAFT_310321 [Cladorrhinum sp. PSN332]
MASTNRCRNCSRGDRRARGYWKYTGAFDDSFASAGCWDLSIRFQLGVLLLWRPLRVQFWDSSLTIACNTPWNHLTIRGKMHLLQSIGKIQWGNGWERGLRRGNHLFRLEVISGALILEGCLMAHGVEWHAWALGAHGVVEGGGEVADARLMSLVRSIGMATGRRSAETDPRSALALLDDGCLGVLDRGAVYLVAEAHLLAGLRPSEKLSFHPQRLRIGRMERIGPGNTVREQGPMNADEKVEEGESTGKTKFVANTLKKFRNIRGELGQPLRRMVRPGRRTQTLE